MPVGIGANKIAGNWYSPSWSRLDVSGEDLLGKFLGLTMEATGSLHRPFFTRLN